MNILYHNSIIASVDAGRFDGAKPSALPVSKATPSHFAMSNVDAMSMNSPHTSIVQTAVAVTAPPVVPILSSPQAIMAIPAPEPPGECMICPDSMALILSVVAPAPVTSESTTITKYTEWTANIVVEVGVRPI
jgi:hypothetical protein